MLTTKDAYWIAVWLIRPMAFVIFKLLSLILSDVSCDAGGVGLPENLGTLYGKLLTVLFDRLDAASPYRRMSFGRLMHILETGNHKQIARAALALGTSRDPRAADVLASLAQRTRDDEVLHSAARALRDLRDRRATDVLLALLDSSQDPILVCQAALALGELGDARAVEPLIALIHRTEDRNLVWHAGAALGRLKDPKAVDALISLLPRDDCPSDIDSALAQIGDRRAVPALIDRWRSGQMASDESPGLLWAVGRLGGKEAVRFLMEVAQTADHVDRIFAMQALGIARAAEAIDVIEAVLYDADRAPPHSMAAAHEAAQALARIGTRRSTEVLQRAAQRQDGAVAGLVREALESPDRSG